MQRTRKQNRVKRGVSPSRSRSFGEIGVRTVKLLVVQAIMFRNLCGKGYFLTSGADRYLGYKKENDWMGLLMDHVVATLCTENFTIRCLFW